MFAIASILDSFTSEKTRQLWFSLEDQCGMVGVQMTPLPHFSWQVSENYDLDQITRVLEKFAQSTVPFTAKLSGLGMFTGPEPVMYLPLVKNRPLLEIHEDLWEATNSYASGVNPYYSPDSWMPHITLAIKDTTAENLSCAVAGLSEIPLNTEILVNNFALIYKIGDTSGVTKKVPFGGQ